MAVLSEPLLSRITIQRCFNPRTCLRPPDEAVSAPVSATLLTVGYLNKAGLFDEPDLL